MKDTVCIAAALAVLYENQLAMARLIGEMGRWVGDQAPQDLSTRIVSVMNEITASNDKLLPYVRAIVADAAMDLEPGSDTIQ